MDLLTQIERFLKNSTSKRPIMALRKESHLLSSLIDSTSYLDPKVSLPQRIHHLRHGHYTAICQCCCSNKVQWYDGDYRQTCCGSCSVKLQNTIYIQNYNKTHSTNYKNVSSIPSVKKKKEKSSLEKYGTTNPSKSKEVKDKLSLITSKCWDEMTEEDKKLRSDLVKLGMIESTSTETYFTNSGYYYPFQNPEVTQQCLLTRKNHTIDQKVDILNKRLTTLEQNGHINISTPEKEKYYKEVWSYTETYYQHYRDTIDPENLRGINGGHRLDHIYSIFQGYRDGIPPEVLGHYSNLQILEEGVNRMKSKDCWKTKEELVEDFNNKIFNNPIYVIKKGH